MKKAVILLLSLLLTMTMCACRKDEAKNQDSSTDDGSYDYFQPEPNRPEKPVIYLYPEKETLVRVELDFNGRLTSTYPAYRDGWTVVAQPDGTLTDDSDREYYCLFWEGETQVEYDLSKGFCVKGEDTAEFLEDALVKLGLTDKEANEFINYWLSRMEGNAFNLIAFQQEIYTDNAVLTVTPAPDSMLRVFMAWKAVSVPVDIEAQELQDFERSGFTVVEWGGAEVR